MADMVKEETSQENIKELEINHVTVDVPSPEEEYKKAKGRRNKLLISGICLLVVFEGAIAGGLGQKMTSDNLLERVSREHEIRSTGEIQLTRGFYSGETDFGYFTGEGQFTYKDGEKYVGEWQENHLNGTGELHVPNEGNYQGECGQCTYTTPEGVVYSGTFNDNVFYDGSCKFKNNTGEYVLTYKSGNIDKASIKYTDGSTYEGTCKSGELTGIGNMKFASGDEYDGAFSKGYRSGQGVYTWNSGDKYDGEWNSDQMAGSGTYTYTDGSYASGTFSKNIFTDGSYYIKNDFGKYTFTITAGEPTAVEMVLENGTTYSGDMCEGKLSGQAQIKYSNGDKYSGSVVDGQKSGQGTYTWVSGASYEGEWSEDQMNGRGTYLYSAGEDGFKLTGSFEDGQPTGECQYYVNSAKHYKTDWSNGRCVKIYE